LIGETLRAPGGRTAGRDFATRVHAVLDATDDALPAAHTRLPVRGVRWIRPAVVAAAAGVAFAAILLMRPGDQTGDGTGTPALADVGVDTAAADLATTDSASPTPAQSQRLAGYLVAHSQFATPIGRRSVWTSVLAQDPSIARVAYETPEDP
jgi:hypothetical protein